MNLTDLMNNLRRTYKNLITFFRKKLHLSKLNEYNVIISYSGEKFPLPSICSQIYAPVGENDEKEKHNLPDCVLVLNTLPWLFIPFSMI